VAIELLLLELKVALQEADLLGFLQWRARQDETANIYVIEVAL
jgi:hypothetical protein